MGTLVSASWDKTIRFWDVAALKEVKVLEDRHRSGVAGRVAQWDAPRRRGSRRREPGPRTSRAWDVATGKEVTRLQGHGSRIVGVAFMRDGRGLIAAGGKQDAYGEVDYWDLASGQLRSAAENRQAVDGKRDG